MTAADRHPRPGAGATEGIAAGRARGADHVPSKRPAVKVAGPYGHPFHPQLVTLPIGAFVSSLIFDIAARLGYMDASGAAFAAAWLLVIGCVGGVLAAVFGIMDFSTIPDRTRASRTAVVHGTVNMVAVGLFGFSAGLRFIADLDRVPELAFWLSVSGLLVIGVGGWLGGKLAYTYGVRVAREARQEAGYSSTLPS